MLQTLPNQMVKHTCYFHCCDKVYFACDIEGKALVDASVIPIDRLHSKTPIRQHIISASGKRTYNVDLFEKNYDKVQGDQSHLAVVLDTQGLQSPAMQSDWA
jgi:hypothetical protein